MIVKPGTTQLGIAKIEPQRLHQMQDGAGHRTQANRRPGIAGDARTVIAQMRRDRLRRGSLLGRQHRVHNADRIAVRVGHQLVGTIIRLAVAVLEHLLDLRLGLFRTLGFAHHPPCLCRLSSTFELKTAHTRNSCSKERP